MNNSQPSSALSEVQKVDERAEFAKASSLPDIEFWQTRAEKECAAKVKAENRLAGEEKKA
jgi:hypothetical protein